MTAKAIVLVAGACLYAAPILAQTPEGAPPSDFGTSTVKIN